MSCMLAKAWVLRCIVDSAEMVQAASVYPGQDVNMSYNYIHRCDYTCVTVLLQLLSSNY